MSFMRFKLGIACLFFDLILCLGPGLVLIHQFLETWASSSSYWRCTARPFLVPIADCQEMETKSLNRQSLLNGKELSYSRLVFTNNLSHGPAAVTPSVSKRLVPAEGRFAGPVVYRM